MEGYGQATGRVLLLLLLLLLLFLNIRMTMLVVWGEEVRCIIVGYSSTALPYNHKVRRSAPKVLDSAKTLGTLGILGTSI